MASSHSSGLQTSSGIVANGRNRINAITLVTDGTNAASILIYDNTAASGTVVAKATASGAQNTVHVVFPNPVIVDNGLYAAVTGTGAAYIVYFGG